MTDSTLSYRQQVLFDIAKAHCLFAPEARTLSTIVDSFCSKSGMSESEMLWQLSTNQELAHYAASVARDVALVSA